MQDPVSERLLASALKRLRSSELTTCFDAVDLASRPTEAQETVLREFGTVGVQYIVAGNQGGKGATCARQLTWAMRGIHPYWQRPPEWGDEPLLCIVAGVTGKIIEHSIVPKLTSLLEEGEYKVVRVGNIVQEIQLSNKNKFVFQSLENPTEARKRLQAYVAHFFWADEQPPTIDIMVEIETRIRTRGGFGMYSFTPLVSNIAIQRKVDGAVFPFAKKYTFCTLDNPVYKNDEKKKAALLSEMALLPEAIRRTRLYGDWSASESAVYRFDWDTMVRPLPSHYATSWRHVEAVDPALKSALGLTVWGEDPRTGHWYLVHSEEISGIHDPLAMIDTVRRKTQHWNITRRVADPHEVWYIELARRQGLHYMGVHKKNDRKGELIKQLQLKLGTQLYIPPHNQDFIDQITSCKWADSDAVRIINSSSFHMCDSAQYFADNIPKWTGVPTTTTNWETQLLQANDRRKHLEATAAKRRERQQRIRRAR